MQGDLVAALAPRGAGIVELDAPPRQVLDPGHPHADERGYVSYPAIDMLNEMVTIMNATRSYQANVLSLSATRSMAMKALEIGNAR
jgi:flagellar basal-body rod protein FlgC